MNDISDQTANDQPVSFDDLAASRRDWIATVLRPWCQQAVRKELMKAEAEWLDIAGRVDAAATLWSWAWERFPDLVHPELSGPNETHRVQIELTGGEQFVGFPDNRASVRGQLVLIDADAAGTTQQHGPFTIDDIASVTQVQ
jgi:hypothetical protein